MPNLIANLKGKVFGRLTVIRSLDERRKKSVVWELSCACGNTVYRSSGDLVKQEKSGHIQSCGCTREITFEPNEKIGHLTPIRKLHKDGSRGYLWEFKCDCGNTTVRNGSQVHRRQGSLHCGCKELRGGNNKNDILGQIFGNLVVVAFEGANHNGQSKWKCRCSCGKLVTIPGFYLRRGKTHCGCKRKTGRENHSFKGIGELYQSYWTRLQNGARLRKLEFNITCEYVIEIFENQNKLCALSGVPIFIGRPKDQTASLDRIDSTKGYIAGNVQWVHKQVNRCKQDTKDDDFIKLCGQVWNYRSGKPNKHRVD